MLPNCLQDVSTPSSPSSPGPLWFSICVSSSLFPLALMGRVSEWAGGDMRSVRNCPRMPSRRHRMAPIRASIASNAHGLGSAGTEPFMCREAGCLDAVGMNLAPLGRNPPGDSAKRTHRSLRLDSLSHKGNERAPAGRCVRRGGQRPRPSVGAPKSGALEAPLFPQVLRLTPMSPPGDPHVPRCSPMFPHVPHHVPRCSPMFPIILPKPMLFQHFCPPMFPDVPRCSPMFPTMFPDVPHNPTKTNVFSTFLPPHVPRCSPMFPHVPHHVPRCSPMFPIILPKPMLFQHFWPPMFPDVPRCSPMSPRGRVVRGTPPVDQRPHLGGSGHPPPRASAPEGGFPRGGVALKPTLGASGEPSTQLPPGTL